MVYEFSSIDEVNGYQIFHSFRFDSLPDELQLIEACLEVDRLGGDMAAFLCVARSYLQDERAGLFGCDEKI